MSATMGAKELLGRARLADLRPGGGHRERSLLVLYHNDTVRDALKALSRRGVLSAPVIVDEFVATGGSGSMEGVMDDDDDEMGRLNAYYNNSNKQGDGFAGTYLGFIDLLDICGALCDVAAREVGHSASQKEWSQAFQGSLGKRFLDQKLINVLGSDGDLLWNGFFESKTLLDVCSAGGLLNAAPSRPGVFSPSSHRIAVFNSSGTINNIVSQSDVIRYIDKHTAELPAKLLASTVEDLFLGGNASAHQRGKVLVVPSTIPAIQALAKLHEAGVSALGVVSDEGVLLSNLSASDLRGIDTDHLEWLALPVGQYLSVVHARDLDAKRDVERRLSLDTITENPALQPSPRRVTIADQEEGGAPGPFAPAAASAPPPLFQVPETKMPPHLGPLSFDDERVLQEARRRLFPISRLLSSRQQAMDAIRVRASSTFGDVIHIIAGAKVSLCSRSCANG